MKKAATVRTLDPKVVEQIEKSKTPLEVLGIKGDETNIEIIRKAYRELAVLVHPDKVAASEKTRATALFQKLESAYSDAIKTYTAKSMLNMPLNAEGFMHAFRKFHSNALIVRPELQSTLSVEEVKVTSETIGAERFYESIPSFFAIKQASGFKKLFTKPLSQILNALKPKQSQWILAAEHEYSGLSTEYHFYISFDMPSYKLLFNVTFEIVDGVVQQTELVFGRFDLAFLCAYWPKQQDIRIAKHMMRDMENMYRDMEKNYQQIQITNPLTMLKEALSTAPKKQVADKKLLGDALTKIHFKNMPKETMSYIQKHIKENPAALKLVQEATQKWVLSVHVVGEKEINARAIWLPGSSTIKIRQHPAKADILFSLIFELCNVCNDAFKDVQLTGYKTAEAFAIAQEKAEMHTLNRYAGICLKGHKEHKWPVFLEKECKSFEEYLKIVKEPLLEHGGYSHFQNYMKGWLTFKVKTLNMQIYNRQQHLIDFKALSEDKLAPFKKEVIAYQKELSVLEKQLLTLDREAQINKKKLEKTPGAKTTAAEGLFFWFTEQCLKNDPSAGKICNHISEYLGEKEIKRMFSTAPGKP